MVRGMKTLGENVTRRPCSRSRLSRANARSSGSGRVVSPVMQRTLAGVFGRRCGARRGLLRAALRGPVAWADGIVRTATATEPEGGVRQLAHVRCALRRQAPDARVQQPHQGAHTAGLLREPRPTGLLSAPAAAP